MFKINLSNPRLLIALALVLVIGSAVVAGVYYNVSDASTFQQAAITTSSPESVSSPLFSPSSELTASPTTESTQASPTASAASPSPSVASPDPTSSSALSPNGNSTTTVNRSGSESTTRTLPSPTSVPNPSPTSSSNAGAGRGIKGKIGDSDANSVMGRILLPESTSHITSEADTERQTQLRKLVYDVNLDGLGGATGRHILAVLWPDLTNNKISPESVRRFIEVADQYSTRRPSLDDTPNPITYLGLALRYLYLNTFFSS